MIFCLFSFLIIVVGSTHGGREVPIEQTYAQKDGNAVRIPINETATFEMLDKWLSQAMSGFMAAFASKRLEKMEGDEREAVHSCSRKAVSVPEHARCVVKVLDATNDRRRTFTKKERPQSFIKVHPQKIRKKEEVEWTGSFGQFRYKRSLDIKRVNRKSYKLKSYNDEPIMYQVARQLTRSVRKLKNKDDDTMEKWRETVGRVKDIGKRAHEEKNERRELKKRLRMMIDNTPEEFMDPRKPMAMRQLEKEEDDELIKKAMVNRQKEEIRVPMRLVRDAVKMALQMAGKNTTGFDKKTIKMFSPRFFSIVPEEDEDGLINLLSPSLFSLHEEGQKEEKGLSLPKVLGNLHSRDQEAWLDFIVEAAGVTDAVVSMEKDQTKKKDREMRAPDGTPLYFTKENATKIGGEIEKRKIEVFEELDKSYSKDQKDDLNSNGFAFLSDDQLKTVYGHSSPYHNPKALRRFRSRRLKDNPKEMLENDIRIMAEAEKFKVRRKDVVASPFLLTTLVFASGALSQPVYLSPLVLTPIVLSPAVVGPIILSPWVFVPLILSPRVLGPLIISPLVFSPLVLSPLLLHPLILVPGVFNPIILTPLVLSPLILSPQVFSPLILSPMVLNPLILSPTAGNPLVLSPFVLSPLIASPQALFALVLSPYALSPLVESKLIASEVVLSPSFLS